MPLFEYKGFSAKGKPVSGVLEADGPADLRGKLLKEGAYLTSYAETGVVGVKAVRTGTRKAVGA